MKAEAGVEIMRKPLIVLIKLSLWYCELKTAVTVIKMDDNVFQGKICYITLITASSVYERL